MNDIAGDVEVIVAELASNAIAASRDKAPAGTDPRLITFRLSTDDSELRVEVWDPDPTPPPQDRTLPSDGEESGRGLFIVAALSSGWGSYGCDGGKVVWASCALAARRS
jgi:anti-sigma regulatory factor (Ser/Thr protein kinase)